MNLQYKNEEEVLKSELPQLTNLINQLGNNIKNNHVSLKHIKSPEKLLQSLIKLYNMVGMQDIKESIAKQTFYLINKLEHGETSLKMLNTVLLGEAGVGKTSVGIILAEIWHHLGFLEKAVSKKDEGKSYLSKLSSYNYEILQFYIIFGILIFSQLYINILQPLYKSYGLYFVIGMIALMMTMILFLYEQATITSEKESDMIVITSRSTFVNIYLGGTAHQTENFLNENRGKVIFIDEAYSLYNGYGDSYGAEALTAINKYMSEHEDEIVIIFAGYEELMKNTIFKIQPGLNRRCMWKFNCQSYDGNELFEIFQLQLKNENYSLHERDYHKIQELIIKYKDQFINNAGSSEQLAFYAQLNHSTRMNYDKLIIYEDVKYALKELISNNITPSDKKDFMAEFAKKFN